MSKRICRSNRAPTRCCRPSKACYRGCAIAKDQDGWREFFDTYWRLIYNVARKSGLGDLEAQEVVQSTFIYLSRRMPKFHYEPARGSFKSWLRVVTRSRISVYRRSKRRRPVHS